MFELRPFASLGAANHGWLDAHHHFSFADYHDPARTSWGRMRVWNDDIIAAKTGFPPHPHRDMEIITYVRSGAITHRDNLGNEGRTVAGDVQVMSAGSGITHSEYNLEDETTTIFQIWLMPDQRGGEPVWGQQPFPKDDRAGNWVVLASGEARDAPGTEGGALLIRASGRVVGATLRAGDSITYTGDAARHLYLVPATGRIRVAGTNAGVDAIEAPLEATARDGIAITGEASVTITAIEDAELVLVDTQ